MNHMASMCRDVAMNRTCLKFVVYWPKETYLFDTNGGSRAKTVLHKPINMEGKGTLTSYDEYRQAS